MADKQMYNIPIMIHKINPYVDYNQQLKRLDTQLNEPTNQNLLKVPKVVEPTIKKHCYTTLGLM